MLSTCYNFCGVLLLISGDQRAENVVQCQLQKLISPPAVSGGALVQTIPQMQLPPMYTSNIHHFIYLIPYTI